MNRGRILKRKAQRLLKSVRPGVGPGGLALMLGSIALSLTGAVPQQWLALIITAVCLHAFWNQVDQGLPLTQIAALLACVQWLVGPYWYYQGGYTVEDMGMAVSQADYFDVAIPATAAFCLGLMLFEFPLTQRQVLAPVDTNNFFALGIGLNAIALFSDVLGRLAPPSVAFALFLVAQLRYVGVLYLWFSKRKGSKVVALICMLPLFIATRQSAVFHDMLLWSGLLLCFWFAGKRRNALAKIALIVVAAVTAFTVQGIKQSYRSKVWQGEEASLTQTAYDFWMRFEHLDRDQIWENAMIRLNQGWIISRVIYFVPNSEPYAEGETIKEAIIASAVPRMLYRDKVKAGGQKYFTRFTGVLINETTSMNLSLLGEGYANFGRWGVIWFLFFAGSLMALAVGACKRYAIAHPTFLFWLPVIFYQALKAETDSAEILNQIVKGGILVFACFFVVRRISSGGASYGRICGARAAASRAQATVQ